MRLPARLLVLVCLSLTPVVGVALWTQESLRVGRRDDLAERAREQAELLNGLLTQVVASTRDTELAIAKTFVAALSTDGCPNTLSSMKSELPRYSWLALVDRDGKLLCQSGPGAEIAAAYAFLHAPAEAKDADFWTGVYTGTVGDWGGVLPFFLRLENPQMGPVFLVAGLDLKWFANELSNSLNCCRSRGDQNRTVLVADRNGTVLFRYPDPQTWIGHSVMEASAPLINASAAGTTQLTGFDGKQRIVGFVPATQEPFGLFAGAGFYAPAAVADIDATFWRGGTFLALSALAALVLAWLLGRRWIERPTRLLIETAKRWRAGDLAARAPEGEAEFGLLATTFNDLAGALKRREDELRHEANLLESRVSERTRALSETNNRLQVEIAEREKTEAALHRAQKLQAVGQLAGGVAHEFNNMLATVLGNLELLERRLPRDDPRLGHWVDRAIAAVQRGAQLTSRLLAFSRRQRLTTGPTDLNALVSDLATLAVSTLGRRIDVRTTLAPDLSLAMADRSQVEAAILNIALNARDAMPEGGLLNLSTGNETISSWQRDDLEPGQYVRVSVTDTGTGMSPDTVARAAEPFFTTKGPGASGLGLSQAYGLARQSGGSLRITSSPGFGTTVSLLLPRAVAQAHAPNPDRARGGDLSRLTILLVDDDADVRQITASMLTEMGCIPVDFPSGPAALEGLGAGGAHFDLAVLDYAMPGMTGIELAAAIRALGQTMPIVLATGYAEFADAADGLLAGVIRKPFTLRQLEEHLRGVLRRGGRPEAVPQPGQEASAGLD